MMRDVATKSGTAFNLDPGDDLNDLRMSDSAKPLLDHVRKFIRETVEPMSEEFDRLGENKTDRWSFAPGQLEVLEVAKNKAKAEGLWNFFLPRFRDRRGAEESRLRLYRRRTRQESSGLGDDELLRARHRQYGSAGARRHA